MSLYPKFKTVTVGGKSVQINALPFGEAVKLFQQLHEDTSKYLDKDGKVATEPIQTIYYNLTGFVDITANLVKRVTGKDDKWMDQFSMDEIQELATHAIAFHSELLMQAFCFENQASKKMVETMRSIRDSLNDTPLGHSRK